MTAARHLFAEARRFISANAASAIASALEWILVTSLVLGGVHYLAAAAVGAATGAATDFSLKRYWAFHRAARAPIGHEGTRYLVTSAASLVLNMAAAWAFVDGLGVAAVPGVIAASVLVGLLWNYPVHRFYVFREAGERPSAKSRQPLDSS